MSAPTPLSEDQVAELRARAAEAESLSDIQRLYEPDDHVRKRIVLENLSPERVRRSALILLASSRDVVTRRSILRNPRLSAEQLSFLVHKSLTFTFDAFDVSLWVRDLPKLLPTREDIVRRAIRSVAFREADEPARCAVAVAWGLLVFDTTLSAADLRLLLERNEFAEELIIPALDHSAAGPEFWDALSESERNLLTDRILALLRRARDVYDDDPRILSLIPGEHLTPEINAFLLEHPDREIRLAHLSRLSRRRPSR